MRIDVFTIFPGYLAPLQESILGRAQKQGLLGINVHDLRHWTDDVHRTVDDSPYGGGPGMVMLPEPWGRALDDVCVVDPPPRLIVPTPAGRLFTAEVAAEYARESWLAFACGRYEGIDQRVVEYAGEHMPIDEVSLGDYVLCGGEVAALTIIEAVGRLIPGVLGNETSAADDSFAHGLLEGPSYTRPEVWRERPVPAVLRSGNHAAIARWRRDEALKRTAQRRPEILASLSADELSAADRHTIQSY